MRAVFAHPTFNRVQSEVLTCVLESNDNVVVSAPTGSGKTGVLEMAMVRALDSTGSSIKIIYLAPTKALCQERFSDWQKRFGPCGELVNAIFITTHLVLSPPRASASRTHAHTLSLSLSLLDAAAHAPACLSVAHPFPTIRSTHLR